MPKHPRHADVFFRAKGRGSYLDALAGGDTASVRHGLVPAEVQVVEGEGRKFWQLVEPKEALHRGQVPAVEREIHFGHASESCDVAML